MGGEWSVAECEWWSDSIDILILVIFSCHHPSQSQSIIHCSLATLERSGFVFFTPSSIHVLVLHFSIQLVLHFPIQPSHSLSRTKPLSFVRLILYDVRSLKTDREIVVSDSLCPAVGDCLQVQCSVQSELPGEMYLQCIVLYCTVALSQSQASRRLRTMNNDLLDQ